MRIILHYPEKAEDIESLRENTAISHAQAVLRRLRELPVPRDQKLALLKAIMKECR